MKSVKRFLSVCWRMPKLLLAIWLTQVYFFMAAAFGLLEHPEVGGVMALFIAFELVALVILYHAKAATVDQEKAE
jgi:phosphate starvation-inducible membrane PsiE